MVSRKREMRPPDYVPMPVIVKTPADLEAMNSWPGWTTLMEWERDVMEALEEVCDDQSVPEV